MSSRSTRRSTASASAASLSQAHPDRSLSNLERLLVAQAVYELGSNSWPQVAKLLSKHPLISRPKSFFSAQSCHTIYNALMKEAGLECTEANYVIHAPLNLKLAQRHYQARMIELRDLVVAEEVKFKTIVAELDDIRAGRWDSKIIAKATEPPVPRKVDAAPETLPLSEDTSDLSISAASGSSPLPLVTEHITGKALTPPPETGDNDESAHRSSLPGALVEGSSRLSNSLTEELEADSASPNSPPLTYTGEHISLTGGSTDEASNGACVVVDSIDAVAGPSPDETSFEHVDLMVVPPPELPDVSNGVFLPKEQTQEEKNKHTLAKDSQITPKDSAKPKLLLEPDPTARIDVKQVTADPETASKPEESRVMEPEQELNTERGSLRLENKVESEPPEAAEENGSSSGDEPLHVTRRATRRGRRSSVSSAYARGKARRQFDGMSKRARAREVDNSPIIDVERDDSIAEADEHSKPGTPQIDDDSILSPAEESLVSRRRESKRKASFIENAESPPDRKRPRDESEPGEDDDAGPSSGTRKGSRRLGTEDKVALKRFQNVIVMLHSQISQHRSGNIFHNPIKKSEAPDYHEIVKRPIDLKTIKAKVKDGNIGNSLEYQRDIYLMFANAMMYNRPGSGIYNMAEAMMMESEGYIHTFRQTEGFVRGTHRS